ncbi:MAG: ErfK/YbiS/YcfS/YnhG family protein [uncultured bacterium]|nr:MAG: ErfK/YbiS/YcfS/YnhG family protein [uncultured bacterium]
MAIIENKQLRITQGIVNVRSGPGTTYEVLQQVTRGDRYPLVKSDSGWHCVKLSVANVSSEPGAWLRNDMCAQVGKVILITQDKVNLRSGPSTSHSIVSTTTVGKTFPVISEKDEWIQIALISAEKMIERSEPKLVEFAQQEFMVAYNIYTKSVTKRGINHAESQAALRAFRAKYGVYSLLAKGSDEVNKLRNNQSRIDKIVINKANFTSTVYSNGKVVRIYPIAYGANPDGGSKKAQGDKRTPEGAFSVANKAVNPQYKDIKGGAANNPLGTRWMGITAGWGGSIGMHGTTAPASIGSRASGGCVRMFTADAEELFSLVKVGTPVIITSATFKQD